MAVLRAKGCSSRIKFLNVRKKVRDWVGLNAMFEDMEVLVVWSVEMIMLIRDRRVEIVIVWWRGDCVMV